MSIVKSETEEPKKSPRKNPTRTGVARKKSATASAPTTAPASGSDAPAPAEPTRVKAARPPAVAASEREMVVLDPTREEIALRAYDLYVARGRRDGHSEEDWARAERQLHAERERARMALRQPANRSTTES